MNEITTERLREAIELIDENQSAIIKVANLIISEAAKSGDKQENKVLIETSKIDEFFIEDTP